MFGSDDLTESDRHNRRIPPRRPDVDAMAADRVERVEIHHILARLAVDPVDRRLDRQQAKVIAEVLGHSMKPHDREIASDRKQDNPRTMPRQIRIQLERACQDFGAQERARTVADHDDFLGLAAARDFDDVLGKPIDTLVPIQPLAVRELPGPDRVG